MNHAVWGFAILLSVLGIFAGNAQTDQIAANLPQVNVTVTKDAEGFAKFTGKGFSISVSPEEPAIPYMTVSALLPPTADLSAVAVSLDRFSVSSDTVQGEDVRPVPTIGISPENIPERRR